MQDFSSICTRHALTCERNYITCIFRHLLVYTYFSSYCIICAYFKGHPFNMTVREYHYISSNIHDFHIIVHDLFYVNYLIFSLDMTLYSQT